MLSAWPEGPCSHQFAPFLENCNFVGRTESLSSDLARALTMAGETYDPAALDTPAINESSVLKVKAAATAPLNLLQKIMEVERPFCRQFGYGSVPQNLIGVGARGIWPGLTLKADAPFTDIVDKVRLGITSLRFDYHFRDGRSLAGQGHEQRAQWALTGAIQALAPGERCAIVAESDPYFAYLAAELGWPQVDFVCSSRSVVPKDLADLLMNSINVLEFVELARDTHAGKYDAVILTDSMEISPVSEIELISAASILNKKGKIVFTAPILNIERNIPLKLGLPIGVEASSGKKLAYSTIQYITNILKNAGFGNITIIDSFGESPGELLRQETEELSTALSIDQDRLFGKAVITASLENPAPGIPEDHRRELRNLWLSRRPFDLLDAPLDHMPEAVQLTIATLRSQLDTERKRREQAEQGLAERDAELAKTRTALSATGIDADFHREQLLQSRTQTSEYANLYEQLLERIQLLSPEVSDG